MPTAINTKHICCLTPQSDRVDSEYLRAAFLMHPAVLKQLGVEAKGAVMPGLNMGIIKAIKLPLPGMQMQREFSARMAAARDQSIVARRYVNELEGLFASLQHRAFRGEL
ncbi:MAG: type I restriction enzyme S subunit [Paracoccaceae bacterium]|jgi:type I restriction enzyme S subunit